MSGRQSMQQLEDVGELFASLGVCGRGQVFSGFLGELGAELLPVFLVAKQASAGL